MHAGYGQMYGMRRLMKYQPLALFVCVGQFLCLQFAADAVELRRSLTRGVNLGFDYRHHGMEWTAGECGSRERQSPIDFDNLAPWGKADPNQPDNSFYFEYDSVQDGFNMSSGGGRLIADIASRGYGGVTLRNWVFNIQSVDFRVAAEHLFKGARLPLEVQLVHTGDATPAHKLIVSVLFDTSSTTSTPAAEAALTGLIQKLPPQGGGSSQVKLTTPADLLAPLVEGGTYFHYTGSLTEPPCTEQVTWLVRQEPLMVSSDQLQQLRTAIVSSNAGADNWRAPMPLMRRILTPMVAVRGQPQLTTDMVTVGRPPQGGLGGHMARFTGEQHAQDAFKWAQQAIGIADGIHRVLASDAVASAPAPAPAPALVPPLR
eukprot:TRINITY_DN121087_c0_g1_i1.p1 TRINITY_DN121087_c0_g1~~TRINITY_DN121087_c0_g1_i1.p1  ORF type:complete len:373 (+),score=53.20 TRINITY_DN121087_c0_g1_i1:41-1159(+)